MHFVCIHNIDDIALPYGSLFEDQRGGRPTMKEVEMRLQFLRTRMLNKRQKVSRNNRDMEPLLDPNVREAIYTYRSC